MPDGTHQLDLGWALDVAAGREGAAASPAGDAADDESGGPAGAVGSGAGAGDACRVLRLVIGSNRGGGGRRLGSLHRECNGLVLDARTWRPLAVPPGALNMRPPAKEVDPLLAEGLYDVIRVDDGTVVTLYAWDHPADGPTWALATSNAYDVSSIRWTGPRTYAEVFYDLARRLYPRFVAETGLALERRGAETRLAFATLDRGRCYTVGFRHHDFHPLLADPERMWQIQSADLGRGSGSGPEAGLPPFEVAFSGRGQGLPGVPDQYVYGGAPEEPSAPAKTVEGLRALGRDALKDAAEFVACHWPRPDHAPSGAAGGGPPAALCYGFILRARDPARAGAVSDVLVETPLLARVRRLAYERPAAAFRPLLTASDRLEYSAVRAFLTATDREDYLALFPQWTARFLAYHELASNVANLVIHVARQRATAPASREPALTTATGILARAMLDHINRHEQRLMPFHKDTPGIVRDYIFNPEHAVLFLRAAPPPAPPPSAPPPRAPAAVA